MKIPDIIELIEKGEGETVEFKRSFNSETIETVVAFANSKGGFIILGIEDNGSINEQFVLGDETVQHWINEIKNKTQPSIIPDAETFKYDEKMIVVLGIDEFPIKPISVKGRYYKRVKNSNHQMNLTEISNLYLKTINSSWDFYPDPNHTVENISEEKIKRFIKNIEKQKQNEITLSPYEFLSKLEFIRNKELTFGAYLLFAKDYCSISDVQVGRFKSEITIIDSISLDTDLFSEIDEIIVFIKKHLMVEFIITGEPQHQERFDYPLDAIREIVVNMIVHRDYRDSDGSIIKIYDNRIEFYNPGNLYGNITIDDLLSDNYSSKIRNKLIAKAFKESGIIEKYGTGIRRIISICKNYGVLSPRFEETNNGFKVTLFKEKLKNGVADKVTDKVTKDVGKDVGKNVGKEVTDKVTDKVTGKVTDRVTKNQMIMINLMQQNAYVTTKELSVTVNISQRKIKENIAKLKEKGLIKRVGNTKSGHWIVQSSKK